MPSPNFHFRIDGLRHAETTSMSSSARDGMAYLPPDMHSQYSVLKSQDAMESIRRSLIDMHRSKSSLSLIVNQEVLNKYNILVR